MSQAQRCWDRKKRKLWSGVHRTVFERNKFMRIGMFKCCACDCVPARNNVVHHMEHLVCFVPAMLALGVQQGAVSGDKAQRYMDLAKDLTYTCWRMYDSNPRGGPYRLA